MHMPMRGDNREVAPSFRSVRLLMRGDGELLPREI